MDESLKKEILRYALLRTIAALITGAAGGFFISSLINNISEIGTIISSCLVIIGSILALLVNAKYKKLFSKTVLPEQNNCSTL